MSGGKVTTLFLVGQRISSHTKTIIIINIYHLSMHDIVYSAGLMQLKRVGGWEG